MNVIPLHEVCLRCGARIAHGKPCAWCEIHRDEEVQPMPRCQLCGNPCEQDPWGDPLYLCSCGATTLTADQVASWEEQRLFLEHLTAVSS